MNVYPNLSSSSIMPLSSYATNDRTIIAIELFSPKFTPTKIDTYYGIWQKFLFVIFLTIYYFLKVSSNIHQWQNHFISITTPASIFKIFTLSAHINSFIVSFIFKFFFKNNKIENFIKCKYYSICVLPFQNN